MPCPTLAWKAGIAPGLVLSLLAILSGAARADDFGAQERAAVVTALGQLMLDNYVFEDVAQRCQQRLADELAAGAFDDLSERETLARRLTSVLQEVTADKHLRVSPWAPVPEQASDEERADADAAYKLQAARDNYGFEQVFRLPGNIGLLDLRGFSAPERAASTAHGAMAYLASSDALIVDLRQNGGGDPEMVQLLCSYFFDEPTHLNSLWWRAEGRAHEFWTLDQLPGPRMADVPVFVLTSSRTFSGAEEFAYNLRCLERATLVGETTGGGAHPGDQFLLPQDMAVFVSVGRAINPISGTNWEGTGVTPHVACPADEALDRALELASRAAQDRRDRQDDARRG